MNIILHISDRYRHLLTDVHEIWRGLAITITIFHGMELLNPALILKLVRIDLSAS